MANKEAGERTEIKVPVITEKQSVIIREIDENGRPVYRFDQKNGREIETSSGMNFYGVRVDALSRLDHLCRMKSDFGEDFDVGPLLEDALKYAETRFEELEYLVDEHIGKFEFYQSIDPCFRDSIIDVMFKPKVKGGAA